MPRLPHFQPSVENWPEVRELWLQWTKGQRPDLPNLAALAEEAKVPYATLTKKTARWKREEVAKLAQLQAELEGQAKAFVVKAGPRPKGTDGKVSAGANRPATGKGERARVNASTPPALDLVFTDQLRRAKGLSKEAAEAAVQALVQEVQLGQGASRISAAKLLLSLAGVEEGKDAEDEASPYETEPLPVLAQRLTELLGSLPQFAELRASLCPDPTTSEPPHALPTVSALPALHAPVAELPPVAQALSGSPASPGQAALPAVSASGPDLADALGTGRAVVEVGPGLGEGAASAGGTQEAALPVKLMLQ